MTRLSRAEYIARIKEWTKPLNQRAGLDLPPLIDLLAEWAVFADDTLISLQRAASADREQEALALRVAMLEKQIEAWKREQQAALSFIDAAGTILQTLLEKTDSDA